MALSNGEAEEVPESTPDDGVEGYDANAADSNTLPNEDEGDQGLELVIVRATPTAEHGAKLAESAPNQGGEYDEKNQAKGGTNRPRITTNPVQAIDVSKMSKCEREEYFARFFGRFIEPLDFMSFPDVSDVCAQSQHGIMKSYLRNTTFTIQVWANYDATFRQFFNGPRAEDCGKLMLRPGTAARCMFLNEKFYGFGKVRFEIGTAFKTLCTVDLKATYNKLDEAEGINTVVRDISDGTHRALMQFVKTVCIRDIEDIFLVSGLSDIAFDELEQLAAMFRRKMTEREIVEKNIFPNKSIWMDSVRGEENTRRTYVAAAGNGRLTGYSESGGNRAQTETLPSMPADIVVPPRGRWKGRFRGLFNL